MSMDPALSKPSIRVRLRMRAESAGGRHSPFSEDYAPHLVVSGDTLRLPVRAIQCPHPTAPGDTAEVIFELMYYPQVDYSGLKQGCEFEMHEGPKIVATGTVL